MTAMKISALIPTHNSSKTIEMTLNSVLRQTRVIDEILVLDDGSKDETVSILESYGSKIILIRSVNGGVARARNQLCQHANGDIWAFLDHDDLWHPDYVKIQMQAAERFPDAVAFYTGHVNLNGYGDYDWAKLIASTGDWDVLCPRDFLLRYNKTTGCFASMSYCCIRRRALSRIPEEPFHPALSGVDDSYLASLMPLMGDVVYTPRELACYRIIKAAQSEDGLRMLRLWVKMFDILSQRYTEQPDEVLRDIFIAAFAQKRRQYARVLMGAGHVKEARKQFAKAISQSWRFASSAKSLALYCQTWLPTSLQPKWPAGSREVEFTNSS
jgi:glycosyltransferase involved in cell wall biosynthesis